MNPEIAALIARHGYVVVGCVVALESLGLPLPGETVLIAASLYAAGTGQLDIGWIVLSALLGAVLGDNGGYLIGRSLGARLLERHGPRIGLNARRLLLGRWLFLRYGVLVVFFGRFTALLRTFAALLAGANQMGWRPFLAANLLGGMVWSCLFGFGAFHLGERIFALAWPLALAITVAALACVAWGGFMLRRHEARLMDRAERALGVPGP